MLHEEHADLLECLAQQEVELTICKEELTNMFAQINSHPNVFKTSGPEAIEAKIRKTVIEKYGSYIEYR